MEKVFCDIMNIECSYSLKIVVKWGRGVPSFSSVLLYLGKSVAVIFAIFIISWCKLSASFILVFVVACMPVCDSVYLNEFSVIGI